MASPLYDSLRRGQGKNAVNFAAGEAERFARLTANRAGATAAALYVILRDEVVCEWYSARSGHEVYDGSRFNAYSVRKSYIGLVAADLIQRAVLPGLDDSIESFFSSKLFDVLSGITVRHLVTHTHGLEESDSGLRRHFTPGTRWRYNNAGVGVLCDLIARCTGQTVAEHLQARILVPCGLSETGFESESSQQLVSDVGRFGRQMPSVFGVADGSQRNLFVSARDLALWGYLHLVARRHHVEGAGPDCLDGDLRAALRLVQTVQTPETLDRRYPRHGFFWWLAHKQIQSRETGAHVPLDGIQILGMSGCLCLVVPSLDLVAVRMQNSLSHRLSFVAQARAFGDAMVRFVEDHTL